MIRRSLEGVVRRRLEQFPCVALLGPRQVGKTTLARAVVDRHRGPALYLDLESPEDRRAPERRRNEASGRDRRASAQLRSGPRQCGKITLSKQMLRARGAGAYYNWDEREFGRHLEASPTGRRRQGRGRQRGRNRTGDPSQARRPW
jgi:predicted AAA+ superfamily ATPase